MFDCRWEKAPGFILRDQRDHILLFRKVLVTNFLTKVSQISEDFLAHLEKHPYWRKTALATFGTFLATYHTIILSHIILFTYLPSYLPSTYLPSTYLPSTYLPSFLPSYLPSTYLPTILPTINLPTNNLLPGSSIEAKTFHASLIADSFIIPNFIPCHLPTYLLRNFNEKRQPTYI